jgi:hypothetical protein
MGKAGGSKIKEKIPREMLEREGSLRRTLGKAGGAR